MENTYLEIRLEQSAGGELTRCARKMYAYRKHCRVFIVERKFQFSLDFPIRFTNNFRDNLQYSEIELNENTTE